MAAIADSKGSTVRKKAPKSSRTGPDRSTMAGAPSSQNDPAPDPAPDETSDTDIVRDVEKVIADAVALGYSVIGDNLAHGRSVATRLSEGSYRLGQAADDVKSAGQRFVQLAGDLGQVWIDLVGAIARDPDLHAALSRRHPDVSGRAAGAWTFSTSARGNPKVHIHPLTLDMGSAPDRLTCAGLNPLDGTGAPITRVNSHVSKPDRHVLVVVDVPEGQAPGHYGGAIRTVPGGKTVGMLSLEVSA